MPRKLDIVYFAWVKERLGRDSDAIEIADETITVKQLLSQMMADDAAYQSVFSDEKKLRFALDHEFVKVDVELGSAQELAIFPPVTGG